MVKRFLYMVALAFVLQLSWGVASAYCLHEQGKASQHFGHHQHEHHDSASDLADDDTTPQKKASAHPDCASCSHSPLYALAWDGGALHPDASAHAPMLAVTGLSAPYLGMPERPRWQRAA